MQNPQPTPETQVGQTLITVYHCKPNLSTKIFIGVKCPHHKPPPEGEVAFGISHGKKFRMTEGVDAWTVPKDITLSKQI